MTSTIEKGFTLSGIGLHSGATTQVTILPAKSGEGRYFVRVDLPEKPIIPAQVSSVKQTTLSTELGSNNATIRTVEHLLAALVGCGIENARIEIDGPEVPLLDGSAKNWVDAIIKSGLKPSEIVPGSPINEPIWVRDGDAFVAALPASEMRFTYGIDFPYKAIGNQWISWNQKKESFSEFIAPARTFGFADQIEQLKQAGLIKGGNLENALVCDRNGWVNPPLRFENEPVRHKLLDLVGDLSLLGTIPQAHFLAYKASHKLHVELAKKIKEIY
ncbi:UDP-3-O-acyl-N-acetylglucosamine deacetylase [Crocosphaera sp. XPORK-15E]|uniref:UDP-3-O-acyl-N-acetylglucosamine deacetylase n=1 Tax=Crocosphaera sp. XPORK-15E TaxID=3110247 RepID=UPI002B1EE7A4|nr:UDP-3-O-acyl-N-acetylglucosamine deacetylase [Crocosphaera sp. XPORK-15E]MEA5536303.1 UDP-3-O-acyl-N-acetylglucosamine deacetylase [Crocosphaera sp. XPORK-15E]